MYCPACTTLNVPGAEACEKCGHDLTEFDRPTPFDKIEAALLGEPVAALTPKAPVIVSLNASITEAMQLMIDRNVGALLVTNDRSELVGILTERDFLTRVIGTRDYRHRLVLEFMTAPAETVRASDPLAFALGKMDVGGYRHLPVVGDDDRPLGVVSVRDVIKRLTRLVKEP
jgi:CBS domain-containing protein